MKPNTLASLVLALAPVALLTLTSCSSTPPGEGATVVAAEKGVPGGVMVGTYQTKATVTALDADKRKVTLVGADGKKTTFKAGPAVVNFNQIHLGDELRVTITEELAVAMARPGDASSDGGAAVVALAPVGAKPGGFVADTVQVTAKITAINLKKHKATLRFPDGSSHTVTAREDVDLTQRKVGEEVVIRYTESLAITVRKP